MSLIGVMLLFLAESGSTHQSHEFTNSTTVAKQLNAAECSYYLGNATYVWGTHASSKAYVLFWNCNVRDREASGTAWELWLEIIASNLRKQKVLYPCWITGDAGNRNVWLKQKGLRNARALKRILTAQKVASLPSPSLPLPPRSPRNSPARGIQKYPFPIIQAASDLAFQIRLGQIGTWRRTAPTD